MRKQLQRNQLLRAQRHAEELEEKERRLAEHYPRRPDGIWVSPFEEEASLQASQVKEAEQAKLKALGVPAHLARRVLTIHQGFVHEAVVNHRTKHAIFPDPTGRFIPAGAPSKPAAACRPLLPGAVSPESPAAAEPAPSITVGWRGRAAVRVHLER